MGKGAWTEAEVSLKDVQESEAFSKEAEQHMQHRDAGENSPGRPGRPRHESGGSFESCKVVRRSYMPQWPVRSLGFILEAVESHWRIPSSTVE